MSAITGVEGRRNSSGVRPFTIAMPDAVLDDLRRRLAATRWPPQVDAAGWDYGTNVGYLQELCAYWRDGFDWRAAERRLNVLPQFVAEIDDQELHFIHLRGSGASPVPIVLTHGWPSSFFEFTKLAPLLAEPARAGEPAACSFDVVVPSLPGFGFSGIPRRRFVHAQVPRLWVELMRRLGYERFAAHGGDLGGGVAARLGQYHPESVIGIHVTNVYGSTESGRTPTPAELAHLAEAERWERDEGAYSAIQATRPQTLAFGLSDSPAGLAGWIVEKFRAWSDCGGELEVAFSRDELLTNLTIYWATNTIASSLRPYWDSRNNPEPAAWIPIRVPCAIAVFPADIDRPPREFAERSYNVQRFTPMPRGGHFAALEQPQLLAADIRTFFGGVTS
jgi:pimeloyl-ACP methyl ester carboxylesterase